MKVINKITGFTLAELLIIITILGILVTIAIPSYVAFINQKRLKVATEDLYNFIKASQSKGLNLPSSYYMSIKPGTSWCYGLSDSSTCDCSTSNSCTLDGIDTKAQSTDYSGESLSLSVTGFNGSSTDPYILFEGSRGTIANAGTITFTTSTRLTTTIRTNEQGLVSICSNSVRGYPLCQ